MHYGGNVHVGKLENRHVNTKQQNNAANTTVLGTGTGTCVDLHVHTGM